LPELGHESALHLVDHVTAAGQLQQLADIGNLGGFVACVRLICRDGARARRFGFGLLRRPLLCEAAGVC
jgi:hypothetical protein